MDQSIVGSVLHQLDRPSAPKAPNSSQEIQSFENRGLALTVAPDEQILTWRELKLHAVDVAKPFYPDPLDT